MFQRDVYISIGLFSRDAQQTYFHWIMIFCSFSYTSLELAINIIYHRLYCSSTVVKLLVCDNTIEVVCIPSRKLQPLWFPAFLCFFSGNSQWGTLIDDISTHLVTLTCDPGIPLCHHLLVKSPNTSYDQWIACQQWYFTPNTSTK